MKVCGFILMNAGYVAGSIQSDSYRFKCIRGMVAGSYGALTEHLKKD